MKTLAELRAQYNELKEKCSPYLDMDPEKMTPTQTDELRTITRAMKSTADMIEQRLLEERDKPDPSKIPSGQTWDPERDEPERRGGPARDKTYRGMFFPHEEIPQSPFKNTAEFLNIVASGRFDDRLQRASMIEGTPSSGGFAVPEEHASVFWDDALPLELVRPRALVWPMSSASRVVPAWDSLDRSTSTHGGLGLQWLAEEAEGTKQTAKLRKMRLEAKKCGIFVDCSSELIEDGLDLEVQLQTALRRSLSFGLDDAFVFGTGSGMPLGCLKGSDVITVDAEIGQAANSFVFENAVKMFARMHPAGKTRAIWVVNPSLTPWLLQLTIPIGTGGSHIEALKESNGQFTLLGLPVVFSDVMKAAGDVGDIGLCDFQSYAIGLRRDLAIDRSIHPGFTQDLVSFRILARVDGQSTWDKQLTPKNGDTMSPFITLAAR